MSVTLHSPGDLPILSILIPRDPEFGDSHELQALRIARETRGGDFLVKRKITWPIFDVISLTFKGIDYIDARVFREYINNTLGAEIRMILFGSSWLGIISDFSEPQVEERNTWLDVNLSSCQTKAYTYGFTFEGSHLP